MEQEKEELINAGDAWEIAVKDGIEEEINQHGQDRAKRAFILGYMEGEDSTSSKGRNVWVKGEQNRIMSEVQALDVTEFNNPMALKLAVMAIVRE